MSGRRNYAIGYVIAVFAAGCGNSRGVALTGDGGARDAAARVGSDGSLAVGTPDSSSPYHPDAGAAQALDAAPQTSLPPLPAMVNVVAALGDDSASITFDPVDGALDYRVYVLPSNGDISVTSDGQVVVHNGTYRCAGYRETPPPSVEDASTPAWVSTKVVNDTVGGYLRTMADATLGYVYTTPGPGLTPVYALGESNALADNPDYYARWAASRTKRYTTSETERASLLASFARDDGIAFYVPTTAGNATTPIYSDDQGVGTPFLSRYYFPSGAEAAAHSSKTAAFAVLASQAAGTVPLKRVYYANSGGWSHDELAAGEERFNRAYKQGDQLPWWSLLWTGITGPTTLVVEALDSGCPYQGHLSPQPIPGLVTHFGAEPLIHQPYVTIDQMRAASTTTEVFINGQHGPPWQWNGNAGDGGVSAEDAASPAQLLANTGAGIPLPKAIARSFITVKPEPHPTMDFFAAFSPTRPPETFTTIPCGVQGGNCFATWRQQSPTFDQMFINAEYTPDGGLFAYGAMMGEWWVTYGDVGADTNGKYRLTANQKASMSSSSFLHVTMEVDAYSTARRYPQILISDQEAPVQYNLEQGHTIIVQPRGETTAWYAWPVDYNVQICNLRTWDVNNQCPQYDLYNIGDGGAAHLAPNDEVGEHASVDHRVLFDVFTSTQRLYIFLDGQPYGCADLPSAGIPSGPVTVTWGDVLYHSAVDQTLSFHADHMQIDTRRHFDNLGFSSAVVAPTWDETRLPCAPPISP